MTSEDQLAIRDLVDRYAAAIDDLRIDDAVGLFLADGVLVTPAAPKQLGPTRTHRGPDAIAAEMAALRHFSSPFHAVHGVVVDLVDDDSATGRVSCTAHHLSTDAEKHHDLQWRLVYRDAYRRTDAGWRFARRAQRIVSIHTDSPRAVGPATEPREETR